MENAAELHLQVAKKVLRYLQGTIGFGIQYRQERDDEIVAYTDSDYVGDLEDEKSTSSYVLFLSSRAVSWLSNKQPIVSLYATKIEFIVASSYAGQAAWLKKVLGKLGQHQSKSTIIYRNSNSIIKLPKNLVIHGRSNGTMELVHCDTKEQLVDIKIKPLKLGIFKKTVRVIKSLL